MNLIRGTAKLLGKAVDSTYTVAQAIEQWIKEHPREAEVMQKSGCKITSDVLKEEKYRNIRFDAELPPGQTSAKVFDGEFYYTVGEYNDAVDKAYGPGGKYEGH